MNHIRTSEWPARATRPQFDLYWVNQGYDGIHHETLAQGRCRFCGGPTNPTAELWAYVDEDGVNRYDALERGVADNPCLACVEQRDPELATLLRRMTTPDFDEFGDWHDAFDHDTMRQSVTDYFANYDAWIAEQTEHPDWKAWRVFDDGEWRLWRTPAGRYLLVPPDRPGAAIREVTRWEAAQWLLENWRETAASVPDDLRGLAGAVWATVELERELLDERVRQSGEALLADRG